MEWFDSNVGSAQSALDQRPEVVQALSVNLPFDVLDSVIHDFVNEILVQVLIADSGIGVDLAPILDVLEDFVLQGLALDVWNDRRANLPQLLWALVVPGRNKTNRTFEWVGTGQKIMCPMAHVGTVQDGNGFVWHLFEVRK